MAKIPQFKDDREAAEFWATHSLADFQDDLESADIEFARDAGKQAISVRLDAGDLSLLKELASARGVGHSTLARMWLKEKLSEFVPAPAKRKRVSKKASG